jgi:hypothetical protein
LIQIERWQAEGKVVADNGRDEVVAEVKMYEASGKGDFVFFDTRLKQ